MRQRISSLRFFITSTIVLIVSIVLLCSTLLYYFRTSTLLKENYQRSFTNQLNQAAQQFTEQFDTIESIIPLFLSNSFIINTLNKEFSSEDKVSMEKQMSQIYYSTSLSDKNFTNFISIVSADNSVFKINTADFLSSSNTEQAVIDTIDHTETKLICFTLPSDQDSFYMIRNLFSVNNGKYIGTFIININKTKWMNYCIKGIDPTWSIFLFNSDMNVLSNPDSNTECHELQEMKIFDKEGAVNFQEISLNQKPYFIVARTLSLVNLTLAVCAPKNILYKDLNTTLHSYLLFLFLILIAAMFISLIMSRTITLPVQKMVFHINQIASGKQTTLPPMRMYQEFDVWTNAFNEMLKKLDISYNDNFQKQLLLKNAEIRSLRAQMNPHFLFNILNTIAWKAEMCDNEEIYQMVISLGELLKMNTLFKDQDFITLEQEMKYVKFYIYLQQMRFEDKISCSIQIPEHLLTCKIPCFCIQPLVENAIVHGLEPKKGKGKLSIQIIETDKIIEISIIDNGVGFSNNCEPSETKLNHTHIGLRNLDRRLELLFGETSRLCIDSIPNEYTTVSFKIPKKEVEPYDI